MEIRMNLSIVGYIKVDEGKPERIKALFASLKSLEFLKCKIFLALDNPSSELFNRLNAYFAANWKSFELQWVQGKANYGTTMCEMLEQVRTGYVQIFLEDHFSLEDDPEQVEKMLYSMDKSHSELMKITFFEVENNSTRNIPFYYSDDYIKCFHNDQHNHALNQKVYGSRYYIGAGVILTKPFAMRLYARHFDSSRPHDWEIVRYEPEFEHSCALPRREYLCSVDDPHGQTGSNLLARRERRFWDIYSNLDEPTTNEA